MARIEIKMADVFLFETELTIRTADLNFANHVGNDTFVSLMQEARTRFFMDMGYSDLDVEGKGTIMTDLAVVYKSQSYYGDRLKFELGVGDFNKYGCDIFYRATHAENQKLVLEAKTGIIFFDYKKNKVTTIPEGFMARFTRPV
ncbi:acyl-CoA thioesterase [Desulfobacter curvatus]|uniref:acyl-CoA thioesterase n=1 Tax=Desulfobacter curvatus TaxID=2290 RepID=UPI000367A9A2|nr:thioesterase family protein [Desulfobacter curvatus]